jgi:hypothetical protein
MKMLPLIAGGLKATDKHAVTEGMSKKPTSNEAAAILEVDKCHLSSAIVMIALILSQKSREAFHLEFVAT